MVILTHPPLYFISDGLKAQGDSIGFEERKLWNPGLLEQRQLFIDSRLIRRAHIYPVFTVNHPYRMEGATGPAEVTGIRGQLGIEG